MERNGLRWTRVPKRSGWMVSPLQKEGILKDELIDVLDDYGLTMEETSNLNKLEDWGIDLRKEGYMVFAIDREKYTPMRVLRDHSPFW